MLTIPHTLIAQAGAQPDAPALIDGDIRLNYQELYTHVAQCAGVMKAGGLAKGDRFAIWAPNCAPWVIVALAGQMLGAVLVTLNTRYKGSEAAEILRRAKCKSLYTVSGFLGADYAAALDGFDLPDIEDIIIMKNGADTAPFTAYMRSGGEPLLQPDVGEDDIADIIFTSGTTGAPKGAMSSQSQNIRAFQAFTSGIGMVAHDRYLVVNPFFHSFGYKAGWLSCLIKGAAIYPLETYDPADVLARIERDKITVMPGAPTIFQTLLDCPARKDFDISSLRVATTGATTIPVDLIRRMREDLGIDNVYSAYGLTESTGVVTLCSTGDDFETIAKTCGKPLEGTQLRFVDDNGVDVELGQPGEIWLKGFNVMQGYLDDAAATAEAITQDGWLKTGDIGVSDARGYIQITDRKKDMVIVGGFNCYPAEVEKALLQHPQISDVAIVGMPDARLGEVTHAHIIGSDLTESDVRTWAKANMANYKVPRGVTFHEALPRNASGKILKFMLKT